MDFIKATGSFASKIFTGKDQSGEIRKDLKTPETVQPDKDKVSLSSDSSLPAKTVITSEPGSNIANKGVFSGSIKFMEETIPDNQKISPEPGQVVSGKIDNKPKVVKKEVSFKSGLTLTEDVATKTVTASVMDGNGLPKVLAQFDDVSLELPGNNLFTAASLISGKGEFGVGEVVLNGKNISQAINENGTITIMDKTHGHNDYTIAPKNPFTGIVPSMLPPLPIVTSKWNGDKYTITADGQVSGKHSFAPGNTVDAKAELLENGMIHSERDPQKRGAALGISTGLAAQGIFSSNKSKGTSGISPGFAAQGFNYSSKLLGGKDGKEQVYIKPFIDSKWINSPVNTDEIPAGKTENVSENNKVKEKKSFSKEVVPDDSDLKPDDGNLGGTLAPAARPADFHSTLGNNTSINLKDGENTTGKMNKIAGALNSLLTESSSTLNETSNQANVSQLGYVKKEISFGNATGKEVKSGEFDSTLKKLEDMAVESHNTFVKFNTLDEMGSPKWASDSFNRIKLDGSDQIDDLVDMLGDGHHASISRRVGDNTMERLETIANAEGRPFTKLDMDQVGTLGDIFGHTEITVDSNGQFKFEWQNTEFIDILANGGMAVIENADKLPLLGRDAITECLNAIADKESIDFSAFGGGKIQMGEGAQLILLTDLPHVGPVPGKFNLDEVIEKSIERNTDPKTGQINSRAVFMELFD